MRRRLPGAGLPAALPAGLPALMILLILMIVFCLAFPGGALAGPPEVTADAAVLMDAATGRVYYAKNPHQRRAPASLTKIMTALVALEYGNLDDVVTVSPRSAYISEGSIIDLHPGEQITLRNLLKAALIMSANDSTVAIAEHIGGTEEKFLQMMNAKAVLLGAVRTRYANTNGYTHPNHYSTAYDLALITRYALSNPQFRQFVGTRDDVVEWRGRPRKETIHNTNRLLHGGYPGVDGVKTGSTATAGNCLVATARRGDRRLITVVLHSANRYADTIRLLDYGFGEIEQLFLCKNGEAVRNCPVREGVLPEVAAAAKEDLAVDILREEIPRLKRQVSLAAPAPAPVQAGQKLGEAVFYLGENELGRVDLVAAGAVPRKGWLTRVREKIF